MTRKYWVDLLERVVMTFLQAFAAVWIVTSQFDKETLFTALIAGAISAAKCLLGANIGDRNTASTAPSV